MNSPELSHKAQLYFSLLRYRLPQSNQLANQLANHSQNLAFDSKSTNSWSALWSQAAQLQINGEPLARGSGSIITASDTIRMTSDIAGDIVRSNSSSILRFVISQEPLATQRPSIDSKIVCESIFSKRIDGASNDMLFRLDQVDFPPGAIAYEHTHPGPGIRYLVNGGLTLLSDHGEQHINTGDAWFEGANSPVTATATDAMPSRFIRAMLLPIEYEGRSTFTLRNENDAYKPRLQTNIRHAEKRITFEDIH